MIQLSSKLSRSLAVAGVTLATCGVLSQGARADDAMKPGMKMDSRYGGPVYSGPPALNVTASLVAAGGGADNFSTATALTAMVGPDLVKAEVGKLTGQYGADRVGSWLKVFDFAVKDGLAIATKAGVTLPAGDLSGKALAGALVQAGIYKRTFYVENMLDKAVSHPIHDQVMDDIDKQFSPAADADYHRITNQAMYDVGKALGVKRLKLAKFH